jgi:hypothetical protein
LSCGFKSKPPSKVTPRAVLESDRRWGAWLAAIQRPAGPNSQLYPFGWERPMLCKTCASENLQKLAGELTASFLDVKRSNLPPLYECQDVLVCLDCGFAEIVIPAPELELLKRRKAASGS